MDLNTITIAQFKARFYRDFNYNPDANGNCVTDEDIQFAFNDAQGFLNQALLTTDANITLAYLYLSAHFLCNNLKAAYGGLSGTGRLILSARSAGSVSESYAIPAGYMDSPILAGYTTTQYGLRYLSMILPQMVGNIVSVIGGANP